MALHQKTLFIALFALTGAVASGEAGKVPRYTFPDTLEAQEAALKANPLMKRFAESRTKLSRDRYRPLYHYVNPESTLNDPNGLCFWNGWAITTPSATSSS